MLREGGKFGHYEVISAIGAGGMGEIYRALDTRLKRDVALKILPAKMVADELAVERFMREAYSASALNHPNILTIYDIGRQDGIQFIATEFIQGETLRTMIEKGPPVLKDTLGIAVQTADALVAAHRAGIVHRDIKPENIMIRQDGYVKVLDFGLAKLARLGISDVGSGIEEDDRERQIRNPKSQIPHPNLTSPGMIMGTANYMSPEQARGVKIDTRSDIFSLGVVLYEMIAGRPPFAGETVPDIIAAILTGEPVPLARLTPVPLELEWSVQKALCKDPEERYQTVKGLLGDLRRLKQRLEFEAELNKVSGARLSQSISDLDGRQPPPQFSERATAVFPADGAAEKTAGGREPANQTGTATAASTAGRPADRIESLAVLPLTHDGKDADTEYLSDGITESIINCLSGVPELRVVPRSTVFRYRERDESPQEIGRELGVCAVFAGRVVRIGDSLVVKTELIDINRESQLWGEQYRRRMTDIFQLQEEIAQDISDELKLKIAENERLINCYTENIDAYQYYLKGRHFVTAKRTGEWIKKGIEYFQKAIDLDPNYALAYSGLAEAYGFFASSTGGWPPEEAYPKAKAAALKALQLDETLGEAHCSLGFFRLLYDWNFAEAEKQFRRAIELSPDHPNAHDGYGFYLKAVGRHDEAIEMCKKAQQLDPLSPFSHISLGYGYYFARDFDRAIEECRRALEMDRHSTFAYRNLGLAYLQKKEIERAVSALSKAVTFSSGGLAFEAYLGCAYAAAGETARALEVLENLAGIAAERYVPAYYSAIIYLGLGRLGETFEWLEKAFAERSGFMPFLAVEPLIDPLRGDRRYEDLISRVGVPVET